MYYLDYLNRESFCATYNDFFEIKQGLKKHIDFLLYVVWITVTQSTNGSCYNLSQFNLFYSNISHFDNEDFCTW